jgi:hypothetical protein
MWYRQEIEGCIKELGTSASGLTEREAKKRLEKFGPNFVDEDRDGICDHAGQGLGGHGYGKGAGAVARDLAIWEDGSVLHYIFLFLIWTNQNK